MVIKDAGVNFSIDPGIEPYSCEESPSLLHSCLQIMRTVLNGQNRGCIAALILSMGN